MQRNRQTHRRRDRHRLVLFIIKTAYREFEERLGQLGTPKGEKTKLIMRAIDNVQGAFRIAEIQHECPNVSMDMIRRVLKNLRAKSQVECLGRGQNAQWRKTRKCNWAIPNELGTEIGNIRIFLAAVSDLIDPNN